MTHAEAEESERESSPPEDTDNDQKREIPLQEDIKEDIDDDQKTEPAPDVV